VDAGGYAIRDGRTASVKVAAAPWLARYLELSVAALIEKALALLAMSPATDALGARAKKGESAAGTRSR
jgi:hypothetical protein